MGLQPFEVVGYTADSDTYCPDCIRETYYIDDAAEGNGDYPVDSEGNSVNPVFADQANAHDVCARCGEHLLD